MYDSHFLFPRRLRNKLLNIIFYLHYGVHGILHVLFFPQEHVCAGKAYYCFFTESPFRNGAISIAEVFSEAMEVWRPACGELIARRAK